MRYVSIHDQSVRYLMFVMFVFWLVVFHVAFVMRLDSVAHVAYYSAAAAAVVVVVIQKV